MLFIEEHKSALSSFEADIESYMVDAVVADSERALSVMLPLVRNSIAIKFAEDNPDVAKMVARTFTFFERFCTSDQAYTFHNDMMASPKLH